MNNGLDRCSFILAKAYIQQLVSLQRELMEAAENLGESLEWFAIEWDQINAAQSWTANRAVEDRKAAELCWKFGLLGGLFGRGWIPQLIALRWAESALNAATRYNERDICNDLHWLLGCILKDMGEVPAAAEHFQILYNTAGRESTRARRSAVMISDCFLSIGDREEAGRWLFCADGEQTHRDHLHSRIAMAKGELAVRDNNLEQAIASFTEAASLARQDGCPHCESVAHINRVNTLYVSNRREDAYDALEQAVNCMVNGKIRVNISTIANGFRHFRESSDELVRAITILERLRLLVQSVEKTGFENDNAIYQTTSGVAAYWITLGECYFLLQQDEKAFKQFASALQPAREAQDPELCGRILYHLGELKERKFDYDGAREYYLRAIYFIAKTDEVSPIERGCMQGLSRNPFLSPSDLELRLGMIASELENWNEDTYLQLAGEIGQIYLKFGLYRPALYHLNHAVFHACDKRYSALFRECMASLKALVQHVHSNFHAELENLGHDLLAIVNCSQQVDPVSIRDIITPFVLRIDKIIPKDWQLADLVEADKQSRSSPP